MALQSLYHMVLLSLHHLVHPLSLRHHMVILLVFRRHTVVQLSLHRPMVLLSFNLAVHRCLYLHCRRRRRRQSLAIHCFISLVVRSYLSRQVSQCQIATLLLTG